MGQLSFSLCDSKELYVNNKGKIIYQQKSQPFPTPRE